MVFRDLLGALFWGKDINLPASLVRAILERNGVDSWFFYAYEQWSKRWHVSESCGWLAKRLSPQARILETGCGCAFNLLWFGQQGFRCLYGTDMDAKALAAGRELCKAAAVSVTLWEGDSLRPSSLSLDPFDAILALNWTYHREDFDIERFLRIYSKLLAPNGRIAIDVVDSAYNKIPNNRYLTSDWDKPENRRRPSEYKKRYSREQVNETVHGLGLRIERVISHPEVVPRCVYIISL